MPCKRGPGFIRELANPVRPMSTPVLYHAQRATATDIYQNGNGGLQNLLQTGGGH